MRRKGAGAASPGACFLLGCLLGAAPNATSLHMSMCTRISISIRMGMSMGIRMGIINNTLLYRVGFVELVRGRLVIRWVRDTTWTPGALCDCMCVVGVGCGDVCWD